MIAKIRTEQNLVYYSFVFAVDYRKKKAVVLNEKYNALIIISLYDKKERPYVLFTNCSTDGYKIKEEKYICYWNIEKSFSRFITNELCIKEAKEIQKKLSINRWISIENENDKKALLSSAMYFHDSYIVKKIEKDNSLEILFNTTWGSYILLKATGIIEYRFNDEQVYDDFKILISDNNVTINFNSMYDDNEDELKAEKIEFDVYFEKSIDVNEKNLDKTISEIASMDRNLINGDWYNSPGKLGLLKVFQNFLKFILIMDDIVYSYVINPTYKHKDKSKIKKLVNKFKENLTTSGFPFELVDCSDEVDFSKNLGELVYSTKYSKSLLILNSLKYIVIFPIIWTLVSLIIQLANPNMEWIIFIALGICVPWPVVFIILFILLIKKPGELKIYENGIISTNSAIWFNCDYECIWKIEKKKNKLFIHIEQSIYDITCIKNLKYVYQLIVDRCKNIQDK